MIDQLGNQVLGLAEIGGNRLLGMDPQVLQYCSELQGHIISIHLTDLDKTIYCHPGSWGMRITLQTPTKEADAIIRGRLLGLVNLTLQQEKLSTSIQERIEIVGNAPVAQKFQKILTELHIDLEQELAKHTGEIMAHRIGQGIRKTHQVVSELFSSLTYSGQKYMQEDSRQMPAPAEFENFKQGVTDARHDVDRLEAKINLLHKNKNQ